MILIRILFWFLIFLVAIGLVPMATKLFFSIISVGYIWLGIIIFFVSYKLFLKNRIGFIQTLDHEMSHMLVSLLFGNTMIEMYIHDRMGGHVKYFGRGSTLISFAPYFVRMPMLLMILLSIFVNTNHSIIKIFYILLGVSLCYTVISILEEAKPYQTDLIQHGLLFSYLAIIALNIIWFCIVFSIVLPRYDLMDILKSLTVFYKY